MPMGTCARSGACIALVAIVLCGCRAEPDQRYTNEQQAALICVAREAALARGWPLDDCIYSVRREGSGWVVVVDRAPGYTGDGEPSVVVDGTFFVHIDAEGRATELLSHGEWGELAPPAADAPSGP